jgi:hypothetical protein
VPDAYRIVCCVAVCSRFDPYACNAAALVHSFCSQPWGQVLDIATKPLIDNDKRSRTSKNAQKVRKKVVHSFLG